MGLFFLFFFSIQDCEKTVASPMGQPVTQIFLDMVGEKGPVVFMLNNFSSIHLYKHEGDIFAGWGKTFSVTHNLRVMYAFGRDGVIPRFQISPQGSMVFPNSHSFTLSQRLLLSRNRKR